MTKPLNNYNVTFISTIYARNKQNLLSTLLIVIVSMNLHMLSLILLVLKSK